MASCSRIFIKLKRNTSRIKFVRYVDEWSDAVTKTVMVVSNCVINPVCHAYKTGPEVIKLFFVLNSAEHKI